MAALITTPPVNGTLCHQEIELRGSRYALCVRSRSVGMLDGMHTVTHTLPRSLLQAFLHAVVSTSGRIHGELLRLLLILADRKTTLSFLWNGINTEVSRYILVLAIRSS